MISKELLSEVLSQPDAWNIRFNNKNNIGYSIGYIKQCNINIYELASKCKEWAFEQGYELDSRYSVPLCASLVSRIDGAEIECDHAIGVAESEPEAVFKSCQWILDNKDK